MRLMRADPLRGQAEEEPWKIRLFWALKWQRAKRVPFGPQKVIIVNTNIHGTLTPQFTVILLGAMFYLGA